MGKRSRRRRHVPQRTCVACRAVRPRRELARIVRTPEGEVLLDDTGKRNGRGAYLCRQRSCWDAALARRQLERALKAILPPGVEAELREFAAQLPEALAIESEESREAMGELVE